MYRALSAQLRILLCDTNTKPLLLRLFSNFELSALRPIRQCKPGVFPADLEHLNTVAVLGTDDVVISCMPFEVTRFYNGIEVCSPLVDSNAAMMPLENWMNQCVSMHPVPVSIRQIIKTVVDRGGGAHVHKTQDVLLDRLKQLHAGSLGLEALIVIAIGRITQQIGWAVAQHYERQGASGSLLSVAFGANHPLVERAARIPKHYYDHPQLKYNLLSVGRTG